MDERIGAACDAARQAELESQAGGFRVAQEPSLSQLEPHRARPGARFLGLLRGRSRIGSGPLETSLGELGSLARSLVSGSRIMYFVDIIDQNLISGWSIHKRGIREIRVYCDNVVVGHAERGFERPDVYAVYPGVAGSDRSGFRFPLAHHLKNGFTRVTLQIESEAGTLVETSQEIFCLKETLSEGGLRPGIDLPSRSGFPFEITRLLRKFRPETYDMVSAWPDHLMVRAVDDLRLLWQGRARSPFLNKYILYLKTMYHRFNWINAMFPKLNDLSSIDAKDGSAVATSPQELLAIANQLYVLKSNGLIGCFLEFGCFKGHSSCCLSSCCQELDLSMEIFDSFAGLPPSSSTYYSAGDFTGTLAEVSDHIAEFWKPRVVNFNKGYFSDTLPHFDKSLVICIWMDVDLFSSAQDVAQILDRLPRNSVLFTHEFPHDGAQAGLIIPEKSEVFPPILDRFESLGWNPVGRYLSGYLGAIWDAAEGIPVIPHHCLMNLVQVGE